MALRSAVGLTLQSAVAFALLLPLVAAAPAQADIDLAGARIVVGETASDMERVAARELQRYMRLLCGREAPIVHSAGAAAGRVEVLVGTPASLPELSALTPGSLGAQGYVLRVERAPDRLVVAGRTPIGVQYGVYSLLEELGVGFYLGGDAIPDERAAVTLPDDFVRVKQPALAIRGSLPWINFLNSPTTWNLEDYRFFFDQMAKMKMNFVGFHAYDSEPFFAYGDGGVWRDGAPAATSLDYGWGTVRGMAAKDFGFGTSDCFGAAPFGSRAVVEAKDADDAIRRSQCVLAQGLQYAKERGIHPCVGFELGGDPTDPANQRRYEKRIRYVLSRFPMADTIWFWQSEGLGGGGQGAAVGTPLGALVRHNRGTFAYLGSEERISEATRVAAFAEFAYRVARQVRPDIRVALSGWGGDQWMRFSDFYLGLDKLLPKDIVFAALDNIDPTSAQQVSRVYGELSPERERWPIPWFESDGGFTRRDQWGPQTNVKPFTSLCRDALAKGCQGMLGIHWQTRGIEEAAAYLAQFAWDPTLEYGAFYDGMAERCFGADAGPEMSAILQRLESLGPRWTGGSGQVECGGFGWFTDERRPGAANLEALTEIRARLEAIESSVSPRHRERLRYLVATIDFLVCYDRAALLLAPDGEVAHGIARAEGFVAEGRQAEAKDLARELWPRLLGCGLHEAMQAYPQRLTSQGDLGNLATINVKAYAAYQDLEQRLARVLARPEVADEGAPGGPVLVVKDPPGVTPEGVDLPVRCAVFGAGRRAGAPVLHYRRPGGTWQKTPMAAREGGGFVSAVPAAAIAEAGVEFYVDLRTASGRVCRPSSAPELPFSCSALPYAGPVVYPPFAECETAFARVTPGQPLRTVTLAVGAVEYEQLTGETRCGVTQEAQGAYNVLRCEFATDADPRRQYGLRSRVADSAGRIGVGKAAPLAADREPPVLTGDLVAGTSDPFSVVLTWPPASDDVGAWRYEVHRSLDASFAPSPQTLIATTPSEQWVDCPAPVGSDPTYAIVPLDEAGHRGDPLRVGVRVPAPPLPPAPEGLTAVAGPGRAVLSWTPVAGDTVAGYLVEAKGPDGWSRAAAGQPVAGATDTLAPLEAGVAQRLRVVAVDLAGRAGPPSAEVTVTPTAPQVEPVFATDFAATRAATGQVGTLRGGARIVDGVLDTQEGGWIEFAGSDDLQLAGPLSFELWFRPSSLDGIPVILSYGHWDGDGYWLQYLGGSVRFYLARQQVLDAGSLRAGDWFHIAAIYDGREQTLYVNGAEVGRRAVARLGTKAWQGALRIGQYSDIANEFQARGLIDDVAIYQRALTAEEVRAECERGRGVHSP